MSKAWSMFESVLTRVNVFRTRYRLSFLKAKDDGLGREMIGSDRFGNRYYQYYSYHGLPTRRIVLYKFNEQSNAFEQDVHFVGWLRRNELIAPTPEELE